jgi:DNA-binding MarR family transcriptional regulator
VAEHDVELRKLQTEGYIRFSRIHRVLDEYLAKLFAREGIEDVTPRQSYVLVVLYQAGRPLAARRIAESLGLSEVTVGRFIHALAHAGWVTRERDPRDGRTILVSPTARAYEALPTFRRMAGALLDSAFRGFSREEIETLVGMVARMAENLDAEWNPPAAAGAVTGAD